MLENIKVVLSRLILYVQIINMLSKESIRKKNKYNFSAYDILLSKSNYRDIIQIMSMYLCI